MVKPPLPRQFALDLSRPPKASLDHFLPGQDGALLSTLQDIVARWKAHSPVQLDANPLNQRWLYWWGPEGSGRSHLLAALGNAAIQAGLPYYRLSPHESTAWVQLEDALPGLVNHEKPSVITVDDVDRLDEHAVAALFRILNEVQSSKNIHIFMAGNVAPGALKLREDLRTRLGWGLIFQTTLLDDDEKIQALQQAAQARGLVLSSDVLPWLLNRFYRDMPNLMALIDALDAYSLETKRAVTLPLVRELLHSK